MALMALSAGARAEELLATTDGTSEFAGLGLTFWLGVMATMMLYNLLLFVTVRDRGYLGYAVFTTGMALGQLAPGDAIAHLLWPGPALPADLSQPAGLALACLCAALFTRDFLHTSSRAPRQDVLLKLSAAAFGIGLVAVLAAPGSMTRTLVAVASPALAILAIVCGVRSRLLRQPAATLYIAGWALLLGNFLLFGANQWRDGVASTLPAYATHVTAALGILLLSLALAERTSARWRERAIRLQEDLANSELLVESLQASEQFLTQGMAQRSAELDALEQRLHDSEQRFQQVSHHDPLTGLANRLLLTDRIEQGIIRAKRHNTRTAVIKFNLDDLATIHGNYGKNVAESVLKTLAARLHEIVREQDTIARPQDDQFVVVLEEVFDTEDLQRVTGAITAALAQPVETDGHTIAIEGSVGSAISSETCNNAGALLRQAGKQMRHGKGTRRLNRGQDGEASVAAM